MKTEIVLSVAFIALVSLGGSAVADEGVADLATIVRSAEKMNAGLTATQLEEKIADTQIDIQKGGYLPSLEFDAADTPGFPGSSSVMGISGIVGSPYRAGVGVGLLASATIWDFGRTAAAVRAAEHEALADRADTEVERGRVDQEAVDLFLECVRYRSQMDSWSEIFRDATQVDREVQNFVFTGQRSLVDKYLSKTQLEQAETARDDYRYRMKLAENRLQILTGIPQERIQCPNVSSLTEAQVLELRVPTENPVIARDAERAQVAASKKDGAYANYMPELKGFASVGMMESAHIIDKQDYGAGIGLQIPIFEGFRTVNGVKAASEEAERERNLLDNSRYQIELANAKFDQLIEAAKARLRNLETESDTAQVAYQVAKQRYFSERGSLIDLREAIRNFASVQGDEVDTKSSFWFAELEKTVFNGGRFSP